MPHAHRPEACCSSDFGAKVELFSHPAFRALEREVLGCDYGGTSWTTQDQADDIVGSLDLAPGRHLLEVGAGSGWPAVYLARLSGCALTLLDLPMNALAQARERVATDGLAARVDYLCADGTALPLREASFGAIGHSDVLCCLPDKPAMLRECRRVARHGARMLFYVIAPADGLSPAALKHALAAGPPFVDLETPYPQMLDECGWALRERIDVTPSYHEALQRMVDTLMAGRERFSAIMGAAEFDDELAHREQQIAAVNNGLLVRERYLGVAA